MTDRRTIAFLGVMLVALLACGPALAESLRVMSFNIRFGTADDGDNSWPARRVLVADTIRRFDPHILAVQEALRFQLDELHEAFPLFGEVGVGRDDGKEAGEYAAILFNRNRIEHRESGTFWFSEQPYQVGSIAWDTQIPRICTWIKVRERATNDEFYVFNVHWDHQSQRSRQNSAKLLLERLPRAGPVIVCGDFNAGEENNAFLALVTNDKTPLRDTFRQLHSDATEVRTYHGFRGHTEGPKVDAVLVSSHWEIERATIDRSNDQGRYPSDHYPVTATVRLSGNESP